MSFPKVLVLVVLSFGLFGCAQVPTQSVELSSTIGRDLLELQRSHRRAIDLLHDRDVERVNNFTTQVVVPQYVKIVMDAMGPRLAQDLNKSLLPGATQDDKTKIYDEMKKLVGGISEHVEKQREELIGPIESARKSRLQELDMAYAQLQQANSVVTAHLASIVKVNIVQDDLLAKAGLKEFRTKLGEAALTADGQLDGVLASAKSADEALVKIKALLEPSTKSQ